MPSPVFKILHTGETDIDSTDISKFTFHSGYPTLKIAAAGSGTVTIAAGQYIGFLNVSHNLGYVPVYIANMSYSSKAYQVPTSVTPYPNIIVATSGGPQPILFFTSIYDDVITLGAQVTTSDPVTSDVSFTANWIIFLDEF